MSTPWQSPEPYPGTAAASAPVPPARSGRTGILGGPFGITALIIALAAWGLSIARSAVMVMLPLSGNFPTNPATYTLISGVGAVITAVVALIAIAFGIVALFRGRPRRTAAVIALTIAGVLLIDIVVNTVIGFSTGLMFSRF